MEMSTTSGNKILKILILTLVVNGATRDDVGNGIFVKNKTVTIFSEDYVAEKVRVEIEFPLTLRHMQPPMFNTNCKNTINSKYGTNHTTVVNNYFTVLFNHAEKLWPATLEAQREKRQILALTAGALLGVIARDVISIFSPTQKHTVDPILQSTIDSIMCSLVNLKIADYNVHFESKAKEIIDDYFTSLKYELNQLSRGSLDGTNTYNAIKSNCVLINSPEICEIFSKIGNGYVTLYGHNFLEMGYKIQVEIRIPKLTEYSGTFSALTPIPLPGKSSFWIPEINENFIITGEKYFNPKKCSSWHDIYICPDMVKIVLKMGSRNIAIVKYFFKNIMYIFQVLHN